MSGIKKSMVSRCVLLLVISVTLHFTAYAQERYIAGEEPVLPRVGVKTNLLYDASGTINLGSEVRLASRYTLDFSFNFNAWDFANDKKYKHILLQPEIRYWVYEPFNGHFFGAHLMWSHYNIGNLRLPLSQLRGLRNNRYEGDLYGLGFSYGYQWILHPRLNLEASFGFGYLYMDHSVYTCGHCGEYLGKTDKHYLGPTKVGVSLIYIIK